jgi:hypothetical protein
MPTFQIPSTIDRFKPSVALASSLHYFGGGIEADGSHTAAQNAVRYAQQMRFIIGQYSKFGGSSAPLADDMVTANPTLVLGPYHKSVQSDRPLSYGLPNAYYAHTAAGAKINVFGGGIYLMQADGSATFTDPRGFVSATYREWNAQDEWTDMDAINAGLAGTPFQLAYLDSMSIGQTGAVKPGTNTVYTTSEWHTLAYTTGDAMKARSTRSWGTGIVFGNGVTSGPRYFTGGVGSLINHTDGGLLESWLRDNGSSATAFESEADWVSDVSAMIDIQSKGKYAWVAVNINNATAAGSGFTPAPFTAAQVDQWRQYGAASFLIGNNGMSMFEFVEKVIVKPYDEADNNLVYKAVLGLPLDYSATQTGATCAASYKKNGVYQRRFERGISIVNPTANDVTLQTLDRTYQQLAGAAADAPPAYASPNTTGWTHIALGAGSAPFNWTTDSQTLTLSSGVNYVLDMPTTRMHMGSITIHPGSNSQILIRGGMKTIGLTGAGNPRGAGQDPSPCASTTGQDSGAANLTIDESTAVTNTTVYIEGLHIDGSAGPISPAWGYPVEQDAIRLQCPNTKVWCKNVRVERLIGGLDPPHRHADCIQSDGGYKELHLEDCYFDSHYNNLYFRRENDPLTAGIPGKLFINNVECGGFATNPAQTPTGTNRTPGGIDSTLRAISLGTQPIPPSDNTSAINSKLSHGVWLKNFYANPPAGTSFGHFVHPSTGDGNVAGRPTVSADGTTLVWNIWATGTLPPADEVTPSTSSTIGSGDAKVYGHVTNGPAPQPTAPANKVGLNYTGPFSNQAGGSTVSTPLVVRAHTGLVFTTTQVIIAGAPTVGTPAPLITGTPNVGQTLHVSTGQWNGTQPFTFTFQWTRDGVNIAGATAQDYVLQIADSGHTVTVVVTAANGTLPNGTYTPGGLLIGAAGPTGPVWTTDPSVHGTAFVGGLVTADPGVVNVTGASTTAYQWERWSVDASTHVPITGATGQSYTPVDADVGQNLICKVTVTDTVGSAFSRTGPAGPVTGPVLPSNITLPTISGVLQENSSLLANPGQWSPTGLTFGYVWERGLPDGTWITVATGRGYVPVQADVGNRLRVQVTASTTGGAAETVASAPSAPILPFSGSGGELDDLIGRRTNRPKLIDWLLLLYTKEGHPLGPIIGARSRKWTVNLNGHDQLTFGLLLEHRMAPLIAPLETVVKLWRRVPGEPVRADQPDFAGIVGPTDEDGEGDLAQFTCYSHDWLLEDRYVWEHLLNGIPFKQKQHDQDQAQILINLLDYTNTRGATGIAEGSFTATVTRDREYDVGQNIWQAYTDIVSTLGGVDIVPQYLHQDGSPFHMRMGFRPVRGTYLQNVRFDYRTGQRNLANLRRRRPIEAGQAPHNFIGVKGQGDAHASPFAARFDDAAIDRFGLREKYVEEQNIQTVKALVAIAQSYVDAEKVLPEVYEATLSPAKPPYYGQFNVGDGVHLTGKRGSLQVDKDQRIYQAIMSVSDDTGLETAAITVGDDVDGLVVP